MDTSSTNIHRVTGMASGVNPHGGLSGSRKFGGNSKVPNLKLKNVAYFDDQRKNEDAQSDGDIKALEAQSDNDDNSSYLSLKMIGGTGGDYSDVESSGNVIRISSKRSESDMMISELRKNQSQDGSSQGTSDVQFIDGASSFGGSVVSGTQVMRLDSRRVGNKKNNLGPKQKSNVIVDDY